MASLVSQKDFQTVQNLPFCYLCGNDFVETDSINRDHLPAKSLFAKPHRESLWLPTHVACNQSHELVDEKIGQLISLRYGKVARPEMRRLKFVFSPRARLAAVVNLNIDAAVWRWIKGFHAALYQTSPVGIRGSLVTPFPRAQNTDGRVIFERLKPQHAYFVQTIKQNREKNNLDRINCNKGKVAYECVWCQSDNNGPRLCIYALDIYDWKDLGRIEHAPARGCAGFYTLPTEAAPINATTGTLSPIIIPMIDPLDPFSATRA
jgi:hypothetical protein